MERVTISRFRVRYAETDAMGIVYHANYAVWFEVGRGDFFREIGLPYSESEKRGAYFPVTELHVRFHAPAHYEDEVLVETRVAEVRSRGITFDYKARNADSGQLLASGTTVHICTDASSKVRLVPEEVLSRLPEFRTR